MTPNLRSIRIPSLAIVACLALLALALAAGEAAAATTRSCTPPKNYPGAGYFTGKIRVTGVSCDYGRTFVVSFYNCRTKGGRDPDGRCRSVRNFSCTEKRNAIPTEIDATVTCRRGGTQRIVHTYQQNLDE